ncbi:MAG: hypothetical protein KKA73_25075 [Chloroflexi bacterium]|nr:hypothetical protein [Chloroflexota bacterium]MBU1750970.1 hypothetical protein [Chloroflexota bacterium]
MKKRTRTTLFLTAGLLLLAGLITPIALANEGVWGPDLTNPSFLYRLGPEVKISTTSTPTDADRHLPAVAHNYKHKEYLVVWHNEWPGGGRDIYGQRVSETGQLVGPWFAISAGTGDRVQPVLAYSATDDEYLVVWMQEDDTRPGVYNIRGRIIAWNGSYMRNEFTIITWTDRTFWTPRVAWNSYANEYMVVWNAFDTSGGLPGVPRDITGSRVTNQDGGKVIDTDMLAFPTDSGPHQVDIAYNVAMNEYLMVCVIIHTEASSGNDIYGRRVAANGTPGAWIEIYKDDYAGGRKHQNAPAVATNEQDKYMVVWEHEYAWDDHDIYGREYNAIGTPDGSYFTISSWTQDDTVPAVAANGANKEWVTVWQRALPGGSGYSIHGFRWGSAGSSVYTYLFDVINWTFYECRNPAVAADIPGYLIVYEELPPPGALSDSANLTTYQHIYGRMWWPEALYLPLMRKN